MIGLWIALFISCFIGILVTSYWAIEAIKTVSERFKISETFIGAVFLSVGTSFPEFINSIGAGISDRSYLISGSAPAPSESIKSFYNITGANIWQILFLAVVIAGMALYWKIKNRDDLTEITEIFWKDSYLSWKLTFSETCLLIFVFCFPHAFSYLAVGKFNFLSLLFLCVWIGYICMTYKYGTESSKQERAKYFLKCGKPALALITLSLWTLFGCFSLVNFHVVDKFKLDESTAFGVLISFVTSSPEFSVMYFLFKQKEYQMAVSGFFGSSLFNLSLPFYSNLISMNSIFGRPEYESSFNTKKIVWWLMLNAVMITLFTLTFLKRKKYRTSIVFTNGAVILALWIGISAMLAR